MPIEKPLEWLNEGPCNDGPWNWILNYANPREYVVLDDIYRILTDGYDPRNTYEDEVLIMPKEKMLKYYNKHFSVMLAKVLSGIAEDILNGEIKFTVQIQQKNVEKETGLVVVEKQIIPNPICPKGCIYLNDATDYSWKAFRLYVEQSKYYTICMLSSKYYWFDESKELIQFEDISDSVFERFLFKSYYLGYPIRASEYMLNA